VSAPRPDVLREAMGAAVGPPPVDHVEAIRAPAEDVRRVTMTARKRIVLIAHDHRKQDLLDWARFNRDTLAHHELYATGTTGGIVSGALDLDVHRFLSGPLGGDQQVGAGVAEGRIDLIIFFWDPLQPQPHDVDVKALLRIAVVHNTPIACNRATADFLLSSPLMSVPYERLVADHGGFGP
jgi:methylglyoxal synthase